MRWAGAVLVALVLAAPAAAAPTKTVDTGVKSVPVASPVASFVAYVKRAGRLVIRGESGSLGEQRVPRSCVPEAASTRGVALACYAEDGVSERVAVHDFVTGDLVSIGRDLLGVDGDVHAVDLGRRWVHLRAGGDVLVNLKTRRVVEPDLGRKEAINLNRTPPVQRLCKAAQGRDPLRVVGGRVLTAEGRRAYAVVTCATKRVLAIRRANGVALNANHVAVLREDGLELTRLSPRREIAVPGSPTAFALSKRALWTVDADGALGKMRLPRG